MTSPARVRPPVAKAPALPGLRQRLLGFGLVFVAAVAFSIKAILAKLAYRYSVDAVTVVTLRMLFSLPFFAGMAVYAARQAPAPLARRDWAGLLALGLLGYYLSSLLDFMGLQYITASLERLTLFMYPTLVLLMSAVFFKTPIRGRDALCLGLSYLGILLVFQQDLGTPQKHFWLGTAFVCGSACCYAFYLLGSGRLIPRLGTLRFTATAMTVSGFAMLLHYAIVHPGVWSSPAMLLAYPRPVLLLCLTMALVSTVLPAFCLSAGIRNIGASQASMISAVGPVLTIYLGYLWLGETVSLIQGAGTALVLAGVLLITLKK
jgi:drug/metabolite transporter (DMT)-like permease